MAKRAFSFHDFRQSVSEGLRTGKDCLEAVEAALLLLGIDVAPILPELELLLLAGCSIAVLTRVWLNFVLKAGGRNMACATTHKTSTVVQGPGPCCAAYAAAAFPTVQAGQRVVATNKAGKCIVCEVKISTSKTHPGVFVFKRGKASVPGSTVSCPSTAEGCCALLGQ